MAGPAAASAGTVISNVLGALTPGQFLNFTRHMTQSDAGRAMQLMMLMEQSPAAAPSLLASIEGIPNLPPAVTTWLSAAISNPAMFMNDMAQAQAALQQAMLQPGVLGNLGL
jgi:hypothetical protein